MFEMNLNIEAVELFPYERLGKGYEMCGGDAKIKYEQGVITINQKQYDEEVLNRFTAIEISNVRRFFTQWTSVKLLALWFE